MMGEMLERKYTICELYFKNNMLCDTIGGAEGRIGNHLHCRLLHSARKAELRGLHYASCEDDFSVCKTVLVGKTVGQSRGDARFINHSSMLLSFSGGEGGTRTPDPAIMSRVL
jgi:hypothetical protein